MNLLKKLYLVFGVCVLFSSYARAGLDIKGTYNLVLSNPSDLNTLNQTTLGSSYPKFGAVSGFGGDAAFYFPGRLGLGVRYDQLSNQVSSGSITQTINATRGAILVGYRLIDFLAYLGFVGTYGITHTMKASTTGFTDLIPASMSSYSVGVEGGTRIGFLMLGAEAGYLSFVGKNLQSNGSSVTINGNNSNLDLSGLYLKAVVGLAL